MTDMPSNPGPAPAASDAPPVPSAPAHGHFRGLRELLWMLAARNLKIRYKGSALGFFWSLLTPLAMIVIYALFAGLLGLRRALLGLDGATFDYLPFLVTGIVVWQFTVGSLTDSLNAIVGNANLVKKVYFPRIILPASTVAANTVNFLLTFLILLLYLALTGSLRIGPATLWLIPAFALHLLLCLGIALIVSTLNVFFRDTEHIVGLLVLAWFFLSPIMYETSLQLTAAAPRMPASLLGLIFLNPMTGLLALYRRALLGMALAPAIPGTDPAVALSPCWILLSPLSALLLLAIGLHALHLGNRHFGDVL